nr:amidase [Ilumatobacteraceae bacterium]
MPYDDSLAYLSATEARAAMQAKTLSPVELLEALIERIEASEPHINAVADRRYDEARAEAAASAQRYAAGTARALEGLPVAAKEEHPMAGRSWSQGSLVLAEEVAPDDHPIIERIQAAGGIIHIRTTTPEFCCAGFCHSRMWGITRNPWNTDFTPGGSSGGSGAALAAGYAPLATGSDIGGSIRIPSSLSGVVGFKPPWARVPAMAPYNLDQFCHDGPMARTVADCALLEDVIAGQHWMDPASLPDPPMVSGSNGSVAGMRVAVCLRLGNWPLDPAVKANTMRVAASLRAVGATVDEVTLPWTVDD